MKILLIEATESAAWIWINNGVVKKDNGVVFNRMIMVQLAL